MSKFLTAVLVSGGIAFASVAGAQMTKQAHGAEVDKVEAAYKADKERCDGMAGNKKDICVAEVKMKRDVAKADLNANYKNTANARRDAVMKKADAEYGVTKEKCDDLAGNAKDVCVKEAKLMREKSKTAAKSMKT